MLLASLQAIHWTSELKDIQIFTGMPIRFGFVGHSPASTMSDDAPPSQWAIPKQVHGIRWSDFGEWSGFPTALAPEADAVWARATDLGDQQGLAVNTADCLPVLVASTCGRFLAAIHAGWRGCAAGIFNGLPQALENAGLGLTLSDLRVLLGPAISGRFYEVGPEVVVALGRQQTSEVLGLSLLKGERDRWWFDMPTFAALEFLRMGLSPRQIEVFRSCTFERSDLWWSYRRSAALEKEKRNISFIAGWSA